MPKRVNVAPPLKHHKATGQAFVRFQGRQIYLGKWESPEAAGAYRQFLTEWAMASPARALPKTLPPATPDPALFGPTISELIAEFWIHARTYYRHPDGTPTREADNFKAALKPLRRMYGPTPAKDFGSAKLLKLRDALVRSRRLARPTINSRIGKIKQFIRWCVARELMPPDALAKVEAIEPLMPGRGGRETRGRGAVEWARVEATLPHLQPMQQAMVLFGWYTGARVSEILHLTTAAIDRAGAVWVADLTRHKNACRGKRRAILIGPEAQKVIGSWLLPDRPDEPVFSPQRVDERQPKRLAGKRPPGLLYSRAAFQQFVRRACIRAGVEVWSPGALRHSCATRLTEAQGGDKTVAQVALGHSDPKTTEGYAKAADWSRAIDAIARAG